MTAGAVVFRFRHLSIFICNFSMKNNLLRMGYVMVSRALLQEICEKKGAACCEEEAFLRVLTNVNFKPAVVFCNGALGCSVPVESPSSLLWAGRTYSAGQGRVPGAFSTGASLQDLSSACRAVVPATSMCPAMMPGRDSRHPLGRL